MTKIGSARFKDSASSGQLLSATLVVPVAAAAALAQSVILPIVADVVIVDVHYKGAVKFIRKLAVSASASNALSGMTMVTVRDWTTPRGN